MSTEDLEEASLAEHIRRRTFRGSLGLVVDSAFFLFGTAAAGWLAYLVATESFAKGWQQLWFLVVFWAVVAYLLLPRVHSILTLFYVPDYFIGRAKTREGLLGDPVNVALRGTEEQIHEAMTRAGWHRADDMGLRSALRTIRATITRRSYPDAPVSALYLFGRMQSFTYQQEAGNTSKRHHVRFWACPAGWLLPGGVRADWMAAGTYDRAIGLSFFTLQLTHRVERDTDRERDYIVETLSEGNESVSVETIRNFSSGYHHVNGGGDAISTDGDLPIVDVSRVPTWDVAPRPSSDLESSATNPLGTTIGERPQSIYLGVLLMVLRVASAIVTALVVALSLPEAERSIRNLSGAVTPEDAQYLSSLVLASFVTVLGIAIAFYSALAYLIYHGHNWARFAAMAISTVAIVGAALNFWHGGPEITLQTNLVGLSFDVLVLLALSGTDARGFAHRRGLERRASRARRRAARLAEAATA